MHYTHLFGPVHSRRLGCSLGVDLVPFKTCSFDCVYCECGLTTLKTLRRTEFFPAGEVLSELDDYLSGAPVLDFVTFSGSGEPTLSLSIGEVVRFIRSTYPSYRVAILTNGSLLWQPEVREALLPADVVLPTLSAGTEETFRVIHRAVPDLSLGKIVSGLEAFRRDYTGEIWLEVFIIPGINTNPTDIAGLRAAIAQIHPDRVQLNTLDRPGSEGWVRPATAGELAQVRDMLGLTGVEAVKPVSYGPSHLNHRADAGSDLVSRVHELLKRRPSTVEDIAALFGLHRNEVQKILRDLEVMTPVVSQREDRGVFYFCPE